MTHSKGPWIACEPTDFLYPLLADVFYPIIDQGAYGNVQKKWVLDRTIAVALNPAGRKYMQQVQTNPNMMQGYNYRFNQMPYSCHG